MAFSRLREEVVMSAEDPTSQFINLLIQMAESAIPMSCLSSKKLSRVQWFDNNARMQLKKESAKIFFF